MSNGMVQKRFLVILALCLCVGAASAAAQGDESAESLKELALAEFDRADYPAAIEYLERAQKVAPDDAEVHYLLGYFTHYLCYDSVPLSGFGREKSDEVLGHLERAVELDPSLGNAYYFIGAEYGARARDELQAGDAGGAAKELRAGRDAGGYPDWMLEFGRNLLKSCKRDAILFTGGDADTNPVEFVQIVEGFRTDVTVIPVALLSRPWFLLLLRDGLDGAVTAAPVSWTGRQIMDMHPYKWKTNKVRIPVDERARKEFDSPHRVVIWEVPPGADGRLDAGRAAFADILVTNGFERPVYFSSGVSSSAFDGLEPLVQITGVARRLLPVEATADVDVEATADLMLDPGNFTAVPGVSQRDMPRASRLLVNYYASYLYMALHYSRADDAAMVDKILAAMRYNIPESAVPMPESLRESVTKLESWAEQNR